MAAENTPLLSSPESNHDEVYHRFSPSRKAAIVIMVSGCGIIPLFVTGTFTPSIPQIARDLNTTGPIVNLAVSLSAFSSSIGGLIGGSYSTFYGRRPLYLFSLPLLIFGSIGVATALNVPALLFWRFIQSVGVAPAMVVGAGVIGDIYKLEERGRAMGVFFAASLLGPSLAPFVGGAISHYFSWRIMQGSMGLVGLVYFFIMLLFFPETSQPGARGIDKLKLEEGSKYKRRFIFVNPLRPMLLLRSPNLLLICLATSASLMTVFALLVPLPYTIGVRYQLKNEALLGLCFMPAGLGNILGAPLVGRISDRTVVRWREKRGGVWYPEDRLRAGLLPFALYGPIPLVMFGVVNKYVDGTPGLVLCLICLFAHGLGIEMAFGPCAAYLIDVMHSRSAESLGANNGLRAVLMAIGIAVILPMINTFGILFTTIVHALMLWAAFGMILCIIRYGDEMRAWVDVGFSTAANN
ncbi:MFS general substrate transporter [Pholiota conissans]|uniref:MFS general substrate transporter n=1 Tax=Pholiota conissans TaxID=109636 RepID=A0A9P5Z5N3_9AGAR|nr:MFS general substrate transporter [Pholiota conissans]